jgi:hypothetical protein
MASQKRTRCFTVRALLVQRQPCTKCALFFEFSLCLSRACLGKMIVFIYKLLKRGSKCTCHICNLYIKTNILPRQARDKRRETTTQESLSAIRFPYVLTFVPSLSWQIPAFHIETVAHVRARAIFLPHRSEVSCPRSSRYRCSCCRGARACRNTWFGCFLCLSRACLGK